MRRQEISLLKTRIDKLYVAIAEQEKVVQKEETRLFKLMQRADEVSRKLEAIEPRTYGTTI